MPAHSTYDYAIVRVVPHVDRGEFINVGVIVSCTGQQFLKARIELDEARVLALAPDLDLTSIRRALAALPAICAGGAEAGTFGQLSARQRFLRLNQFYTVGHACLHTLPREIESLLGDPRIPLRHFHLAGCRL